MKFEKSAKNLGALLWHEVEQEHSTAFGNLAKDCFACSW